MTDPAPPANRSAYVAPTTIPRPVPRTTMESELVKLSPEADPRNAPTQLSLKAVKRHERKLSWIAFVAGAVGALIASLLYLDVFTDKGPTVVTESNDGSRERVASDTNTASPVPTAMRANEVSERTAVLEFTQLPLVPDRFAGATETPAQQANTERTKGEDQEPKAVTGTKPPPARTQSAETEAPSPGAEPGRPKREPATAAPPPGSTSKVWVEPPPRKVWVE